MTKRNDNLLLAAGVLGAFGVGLVTGKALVRSTPASDDALPQASLLDTIALGLDVFAPAVAKGAIIRRPKVVGLAERFALDRRAVQRMQKLRNKYGEGPLMLRLPIRKQAVVLAPAHVHRVLNESPDPFSPASTEKRAALSHFEPKGVLISQGEERTERRAYNEAVLDHRQAVHSLVDSFLPKVEEEVGRMLAIARRRGELDWDAFARGWYRLVRRVVFGESAADDQELNDLTVKLRRNANWAIFHPKDRQARERFFERIAGYLARAEPGSLAGMMAGMPTTPRTEPVQQVPQWLFAFDAAGMTTFRALALLATHPDQAARARKDMRSDPARQHLPFLRATVLEAVRLWPTTPMILRQSTRATHWDNGTMPADTGVLVYAPFFHRDDQRLPHADLFTPELWLKERSDKDWPLVPFSEGAAGCPGRNLVLLLASSMLAALLDGRAVELAPGRRLDPARLPGTLDNYTLRFKFTE
ncbi:cytochrome P450 [Massilia norwichensis]|uniref:Cytochrome P450 n=1 Tax=Massilia norwichensis TaxID=1442366 RepID=A0ABT2ABN5_9BURK|nr:cytochrome P450 [Massilia norwichensis]MCS0591631.1 cytochrome P450 [Massilia norwichensis]